MEGGKGIVPAAMPWRAFANKEKTSVSPHKTDTM